MKIVSCKLYFIKVDASVWLERCHPCFRALLFSFNIVFPFSFILANRNQTRIEQAHEAVEVSSRAIAYSPGYQRWLKLSWSSSSSSLLPPSLPPPSHHVKPLSEIL